MTQRKTYPISVDKELNNDLKEIKGILENQTGMFISIANVLRVLVKTWHDVNNNG